MPVASAKSSKPITALIWCIAERSAEICLVTIGQSGKLNSWYTSSTSTQKAPNPVQDFTIKWNYCVPLQYSRLRWSIIAVASIATLIASGLLWVLYLQVSGNIHLVDRAGVYRSGQLSSTHLHEFIREHGIKTVINLRGAHPGAAWFEQEARIVKDGGAQLVNIRLSANHVPDQSTLNQLLETLRSAKKPFLIHCNGGSDRTGLASALYEVTVAKQTPPIAGRQLSFRYGHFPWLWSRSGAMDATFRNVIASMKAGTNP